MRVKVHRVAPENTSRARKLRKDSTDAENILWNLLRNRQLLGYKIHRQVPIGKYFADFVCRERRLIIEVDGGHHRNQKSYDDERTEWLESQGYEVIRFWNSDVVEQSDGIQETILAALQGDS